ncbi:MAG: aspartate 1-decarboxylase [Sulfobacillus benefaciens]|uniref:Aspartate 1-decarboxylase n=1 Tax=Sulfobacillus benefaciens TaxID=453960 RepID=A0A2T2XAW8_9FIRM|nr:MAG: aspartate 1-decarboxylase [Sulfobacillus benefaciens]
MQYRMLAAKIHRARVTEANLNYIGSITIDQALLEATGLLPYEMVQITNLSNGAMWQTYIIAGAANQGDICLNGPPARLFQPDDLVVILGYRVIDQRELESYRPVVVFVDDDNHITKIVREETPFTVVGTSR